jgi:hypothetical protein
VVGRRVLDDPAFVGVDETRGAAVDARRDGVGGQQGDVADVADGEQRTTFFDGYLNCAVTNGAIITAQFGDAQADPEAARSRRS